MRYLPYLIVGMIHLLMCPKAVLRAEFWAEDGVVFFADAFQLGWRSLFIPLGGYQNVLPRLLAVATSYLPVLWAPYVYALCCWTVTTFCLGYFSRPGFGWLVESRTQRILFCALFAIAPGIAEVRYALCNLHTVFAFFFLLLVLERPLRIGWGKAALMVLLALSTPELPILVVPLVYLWWRERDPRYPRLAALIVAVLILNSVTSRLYQTRDYGLVWSQFLVAPKILAERFTLHAVILPVLGPNLGNAVFHLPAPWFAVLLALTVIALAGAWQLFRAERDKLLLAFLLSFSGVTTFALMAVTRPYLFNDLNRLTGDIFWNNRYGFVATCFSLIAWGHLSSTVQSSGLLRNAGRVAVLLLSLQLLTHRSRPYPRADLHWPQSARRIEDAIEASRRGLLRSDSVIGGIPLQPNGYMSFSVTVPGIHAAR